MNMLEGAKVKMIDFDSDKCRCYKRGTQRHSTASKLQIGHGSPATLCDMHA